MGTPTSDTGYRSVESTLRYLPWMSRLRARWPNAAMLLSVQTRLPILAEIGLALLAEILVLQVLPRLATVGTLASILPYAAGVSVVSGIRRGQTQFYEELERVRFLSSLVHGGRWRPYVSATTGYPLMHAGLCVALSPLGVLAAVLGTHDRVDAASAFAVALAWPLFVLLRVAAGHIATLARELQPPQVAYLISGALFGSVLAAAAMNHDGPASRRYVGIVPSALPGPAWVTLGLEVVACVAAVLAMHRAVGRLVTCGPVAAPRLCRLPCTLLPQWLPLRSWLAGGRSTGSVVFGFATICSVLAGWLARHQGVLMRLPRRYDAVELGVVILYMGAYLAAILFATPADLRGYARTRPLLLLGRASLHREAIRRVSAVLVPVLAVAAAFAAEMSGRRPMALVPAAILWTSIVPLTLGAVGVVVLPALSTRSPGFHAADDELPVREFFASGLGCLMPSALVVGFLTVAQRSGAEVIGCLAVVVTTALALVARLAVHVSLQDRTTT